MNDFKEGLVVPTEKLNKNNEIIRKLDELEKIYNPKIKEQSTRTQVLRSGENILFNIMLVSGMLFGLNNSRTIQNTIDTTISGRIKSIESEKLKEERNGRKDKQNGDIFAFNLVIDRVHNSKSFPNVFMSDEIQALYNERKLNLAIMKMIVQYIESFDEYDITAELDEDLTGEELKKKLEDIKQDCRIIEENIKIYNDEDNIGHEGFSVDDTMRKICTNLFEEEINKVKQHVEKLEKEKKEKGCTEKMKRMLKASIFVFNEQIDSLEKNEDLEDVIVDVDDAIAHAQMCKTLLKYLENKRIEEMLKGNEQEDGNKKYCEISILLLYQLLQLEFVEGINYEKMRNTLYVHLKEYKNAELDASKSKYRYSNVTLESLQTLTKNLKKLNARLSDPLQYEISKYFMKQYINPIIRIFKGKTVERR